MVLFLCSKFKFIISQTQGRSRFQLWFWTQHSASLMERIPQRDRESDKEREGKEMERGRERERDWEGESSREGWSPLRNDRIAVKLVQAEGSDDTHTFAGRPETCLWIWEELGGRGEPGNDSDYGKTTFPAQLAVALRNLEPNRWENIWLYSATPRKKRGGARGKWD